MSVTSRQAIGASFAAHQLGRGRLAADLRWGDITGAAVRCGWGRTVSPLITELACADPEQEGPVKTGVPAGSAIVGGARCRPTADPTTERNPEHR